MNRSLAPRGRREAFRACRDISPRSGLEFREMQLWTPKASFRLDGGIWAEVSGQSC
jgi:hypothetical protein